MRQLFNVVHHAVELPLPVDLAPTAQRKAGQPFVVSQVAEHRFDRGKARRDHAFAFPGVDPAFHLSLPDVN